ncbi:MAG TPA: protealysin inhibitor emfourin [Chloroflexota bacterium]|jgi:hypothetical protein
MRIEVVRRGGIVGIPLRGTLDTGDLPDSKARIVENAVQSLRFDQPPSPPRHPDGFEYEFALEKDGDRRSVILDEADVPETLRPIVDEAVTSELA